MHTWWSAWSCRGWAKCEELQLSKLLVCYDMQLCLTTLRRAQRGYSTTSEWDLVCGDGWKRYGIQAAFFLGWLLGSAGFAWLAEEFGACM